MNQKSLPSVSCTLGLALIGAMGDLPAVAGEAHGACCVPLSEDDRPSDLNCPPQQRRCCRLLAGIECDERSGQFLGEGTTCQVAGVRPYLASPGIPIPDHDPAGARHTLLVPDHFQPLLIRVAFATRHPHVGELVVTLERNGRQARLIDRPGVPASPLGCQKGGYRIALANDADLPIETLCTDSMVSPPLYLPHESFHDLEPVDAFGEWTLIVSDHAASTVGAIDQWGLLFIEPGRDPCGVLGACCGLASGCSDLMTAEQCAAAGGGFAGGDTWCTERLRHGSVYGPEGVSIPDNDPAGIISRVPVYGGSSRPILDLDVTPQIDHPRVGDLIVRLLHEDKLITLLDRPGAPATPLGCWMGRGYEGGITLDDEGTGGSIENLCAEDMRSPPNYKPHRPLSAFDGLSSSGDWFLQVIDRVPGESGSLLNWAAFATRESHFCDLGSCCLTTGFCFPTIQEETCVAAGGQFHFRRKCSELDPPCQGCGNGIREGAEECDGEPCCNSDCTIAASTTICRPSIHSCDAAETCSGDRPDCPANAPIATCIDADRCCPPGCTLANDSDCTSTPGVCCEDSGCKLKTAAECGIAPGGQYQGDGTSECQVFGAVHTYVASPGIPIPDNNPAGASHTIVVPDDFVVGDVNVGFSTRHPWVGELRVLLSRDGSSHALIDRPGVPATALGCDQGGYHVILDDEGMGGSIETLCSSSLASPPSYTPAPASFAGVEFQRARGHWTIIASDHGASHTGAIDHWGLQITELEYVVCPSRGACCIPGDPTCRYFSRADCAALGGNFAGHFRCEIPEDPPCQFGACCIRDTHHCIDYLITEERCHEIPSGEWHVGLECSETDCSVCGNGIREGSEQCDEDHRCCTAECTIATEDTVCRASSGPCDPSENCPGDNMTCPPDARVTACADSDGCCPQGCNGAVDDDCPSCGRPGARCNRNSDCCSNRCVNFFGQRICWR